MTEVILFNPPIYFENRNPMVLDVSSPPMGLLYLAAMLEKNDISVSIVDVGAEKLTLDQVLQKIEVESPKVIGISSMTPNLQGTVQLAKAVKKRFGKNVKIALGGSHISADPNFINRIRYFDLGITGEAELTFTHVVKQILRKQKIKRIYVGQIPENLDALPFPARHLIDNRNYMKKGVMIATRGCPYNCYYCSRPAVSKKVRCRSAKNVVDEMESVCADYGGFFHFQDDTLTINRKNTIELCNELISRKLNVRWIANTRIDLVDEKLLKKMHKAGCDTLVFGIEAGNERIRNDVVKKRFTDEQIRDVVRLCKKYNINADGFFMLGHPGETEKEILDTINFAINLDFNIIGLSIATPFPGSELFNISIEKGIINKNFIDNFAKGILGKGYAGVYPVFIPDGLTRERLEHFRRLAFRKFYLRPKYVLNRLVKDFSSINNLKRDLAEGVNLLLHGSSKRAPYQKPKAR